MILDPALASVSCLPQTSPINVFVQTGIKLVTAKGVINTMIKNSFGILGALANAEFLEDRLGIMVGKG